MNVLLEEVTFRRGRRTVLDVAQLEFAPGTMTALVGRNGSGKTTLLRVVAGLERPDAGMVVFNGEPIRSARDASQHVAIAFQRAVVLRGTVRENLDIGLRLRGLAAPARAEQIEEVAHALGIEHLIERSAQSLSGGEAQRLNLARALSLRAPVTLLDEPLSGLDAESHAFLLRELPRLLRQFATTAIIVTHDHREATRLASNLVLLDDGRVTADGTVDDLLRKPPNIGSAAYFGFTLLPRGGGGFIAIAPGALHLGDGGVPFEVAVEQIVRLGHSQEIVGTIGSVAVSLAVDPALEAPMPGTTVTAYADPAATVCFDRPG